MTRYNKRKTNNQNIFIKIISTIVICLLFILIINIQNIKNYYLSKITGYNTNTISVFIENNIYDTIKNHDYSKTLENILNTKYYDQKYIKEYLEINYIENDSFLKNTSELLDKGYNHIDINNIYKYLSEDSINILLNNNYIEDITNIISIEYFHENNLERYIKYQEQKELDIETSITYVNIGLDKEYYTNVIDIENPSNITVLVNKYNKLPKNYEPNDLIALSATCGNGLLKKEAAEAFEKMCKDAKKDNIIIYGASGYRSYNYQLNLYNRYVALDGQKEADTYSARAGYSEHQTGLAMDVMNGKWQYLDKSNQEYKWLIDNSYKYGYILRYLEGKEEITGYMYEPWHFRYIGIELATEITNLKITYDEYVAKNS